MDDSSEADCASIGVREKTCIKCRDHYSGFGDICVSCRRVLRSEGTSQICVLCNGFFWGFTGVCEDCDAPLCEGWLYFPQETSNVSPFCQLFHSRLDAWSSAAEAAQRDPPVFSWPVSQIQTWKPVGKVEGYAGGFEFDFSKRTPQTMYVRDAKDYRNWTKSWKKIFGARASRGKRTRLPRAKGPQNGYLTKLDKQVTELRRNSNRVAAVSDLARVRIKEKAHQHQKVAEHRELDGKQYRNFFKMAGREFSGHISWPGFEHLCRHVVHLGMNEITDAELRLLYRSLAPAGSEGISSAVLVAFMMDPVRRIHNRFLNELDQYNGNEQMMFLWGDKDSNGSISWDEFLIMCREDLNIIDNIEELRAIFQVLDVDASGDINEGEFSDFLSNKTFSIVTRCTRTNQPVHEGWLRLAIETNAAQARIYVRLSADRIKAWMSKADAECSRKPVGEILLNRIVGWRLHTMENGGFLLFNGLQSKVFYCDDAKDLSSWASFLLRFLAAPDSAVGQKIIS